LLCLFEKLFAQGRLRNQVEHVISPWACFCYDIRTQRQSPNIGEGHAVKIGKIGSNLDDAWRRPPLKVGRIDRDKNASAATRVPY
jgi:hypothetical protein